MIRRPPRSTQSRSSAASDVYKRQHKANGTLVLRPAQATELTLRRSSRFWSVDRLPALVVNPRELLSRHRMDRIHDLVGRLTASLRGGNALEPAGEVEGWPELHRHLGSPREARSHRLQPLGPGQGNWYDGNSRRKCQPRGPCPTAVEPAVQRTGPLRIDPERPSGPEHPQCRVERLLSGPVVVTVDRDHVEEGEPSARERALDPGAGEVVALG